MEIAEIISIDGEVFTKEDLSNKKIQFDLLRQIDFNTVQEFYFNKLIVSTTREKETKSNGSNGLIPIDLLDKLKWSSIEPHVNELIVKGYLEKIKFINGEMYFTKQKTKTK